MIKNSIWPRRLTLLAILLAARLMLLPSALDAKPCPSCHPMGIVVTTLLDDDMPGDSKCSLREAINNANAKSDTTDGDCAPGTGRDTIVFGVSGTIMLSSALPAIANVQGSDESLTINGSGQVITVDGADTYQVFVVNELATLSVNDLTIAHGNSNSYGGAIYHSGGTLTVTNSTFSGNRANGDGGGICFSPPYGGTLTVTNCKFYGNSAGSGGAIANLGEANISNTIISGNSAREGAASSTSVI